MHKLIKKAVSLIEIDY